MSKTFDLIILGGGPAGYVCAIRAAQLGLTTAVVERDKLGGVCVNVGCIPSKALLHSAYVANLVKHDARRLGVNVGEVSLDFAAAIKHSRQVSEQNSKGVGFLMKKHGVTVIQGTGVLGKDRTVTVDGTAYTASKAIVLATGTRVKGIPQIGLELDKQTVLSTDEALFLQQAPASVAIVGGGAVGCEFADVFNAFGAKVTRIEMLPQILPLEDAEAADALAKSFKKRKIDMLVAAKVTKAEVRPDGVTLSVEVKGETKQIEAEKVLMAAGRALNLENVGLEAAGVQRDERGFLKVDDNLQTTAPGVYAIGDIAGPPMLAHKGSREGVLVAEVIAGQTPHPIRYDNVPSVTYCHPEVASIGLTEEQARESGQEIKVGKYPLTSHGRALSAGHNEGFVKIIADAKYGEILGVHMIGYNVSELIGEAGMARALESTVEEIAAHAHAHPSMAEAVMEAALAAMDRAIHI